MIELPASFIAKAAKLTRLGIKGLRVTPEYFARREANRKAVFGGGLWDENTIPEEDSVLNITELQQLYPKLYQENPKEKSTFKPPNGQKHRCYTNSYQSYKNAADKKAAILVTNNRWPIKEIVWHLLIVLTSKEIKKLRTKIFRYLKDHGIVAVVAIELTRGKNGEPNNTVHFHILTDDPRSEEELEKLLIKACERKSVGLDEGEDFIVGFRELTRPETCFDYFTKRNRTDKDWCKLNKKKRVILFEKGTGLQKFYEIGKWYKKKESELWEDFKDICFGKNRDGKKSKWRRRKKS